MVRCTYRFVLISLLFTLLGLTLRAQSVGSEQAYDVVILNGKVVDGTGNPWFYGDVAIRGDRNQPIVLGFSPAMLPLFSSTPQSPSRCCLDSIQEDSPLIVRESGQ